MTQSTLADLQSQLNLAIAMRDAELIAELREIIANYKE